MKDQSMKNSREEEFSLSHMPKVGIYTKEIMISTKNKKKWERGALKMNDNGNITRHMVLHSSNRYSDHNFAIIIAMAAALTKLLNNCIITTSQPLP
jgi:hypothetical protein